MRYIYTGLDIGSNKIKICVCELVNNKLNLLAQISTPSVGIKRGLITNAEAAISSLKKAFNQIEDKVGFKINKVLVNIPVYKANFKVAKASIKIQNIKSTITGNDVRKVLTKTVKENVVENFELATDLLIDFKVDDKGGIKDPKGLLANNLEAKSLLALVPQKNLYSVATILESIGIEIDDVTVSPVSDMATFKTKAIESNISALINVGYETTLVSLYNKSILVKNSVIPLGSQNIDSDLSYIYKIKEKDAINLKEKFVLAHKRNASVNEFYEVTNTLGEQIKINQFEASEIVMARLEEILTLARKEINNLTSNNIDYIIITGGTSNMLDFQNIINDVFGKKAILGNVKMIGLRDNSYSVALGNVIQFINRLKLIDKNYTMIENDEKLDTKKGINISNDFMLSKVFDYFFSE